MSLDRYITYDSQKRKYRVRCGGISVGCYLDRDEARTARDSWCMTHAPHLLSRMTEEARKEAELARRAHQFAVRARPGSPWLEVWRDKMLRESYERCDSIPKLADQLGVDTGQVYMRARTLGLKRQSPHGQAAAKSALTRAANARARNGASRPVVSEEEQTDFIHVCCKAPDHDEGIVAKALASMPDFQRAWHGLWKESTE